MFENLRGMASMLSQAKEMSAKIEQAHRDLEAKSVEGESGAGAVRVTMTGTFDVVQVRFDPAMVSTLAGEGSDADQAMVEELVTAAMNSAVGKAKDLIREELTKAAGGVSIPGLDRLLGGGGGMT